MKLTKRIIWTVLACFALAAPAQEAEEMEWYLGEVVSDVFVKHNHFEYYYMPSASDMEQQRQRGEVTYFLNTPPGYNVKKTRDQVDRLMASYDDITAVNEWQSGEGNYWKEFRYGKNKFRFSVARKAVDEGVYYVSVVESANYYKSLGKGNKETQKAQPAVREKKEEKAKEKPVATTKRSTRSRRAVTDEDVADHDAVENIVENTEQESVEIVDNLPVMDEKTRRKLAREHEEARQKEQKATEKRAKALKKEEEKKQKEAERLKREEEQKQKLAELKQKREEEKRQRELAEQERKEAEQAKREAKEREKAAQQSSASKYNFDDVALWLSEKYDFTQTEADNKSCTMYSSAVKDVDMAKLAVKNALKGSNARMAMPWRINQETGQVETGYTVDGHVLVFTITPREDGLPTVTITQVSGQEFENFKNSLGN